jgi:Domain of unknown function (DUF5664)
MPRADSMWLNTAREIAALDAADAAMPTFAKADASKLRLSLIPPEAILALGRVLTFGAAKYGDNNWRLANSEADRGRIIDALLRHLIAHLSGERLDVDSGLPHLEHVLCNAAFLVALTTEAT